MVVGDNESTATKNAVESLAISIAKRMRRYDAGRIARWSTSRASLGATGAAIGWVPALYHPGVRHGLQIWMKHTKH